MAFLESIGKRDSSLHDPTLYRSIASQRQPSRRSCPHPPRVYNAAAMPRVTLPYGEGTIEANLPERARVVGGGADRARRLEPAADQMAAVREAF
jgi:hypothetical protein